MIAVDAFVDRRQDLEIDLRLPARIYYPLNLFAPRRGSDEHASNFVSVDKAWQVLGSTQHFYAVKLDSFLPGIIINETNWIVIELGVLLQFARHYAHRLRRTHDQGPLSSGYTSDGFCIRTYGESRSPHD